MKSKEKGGGGMGGNPSYLGSHKIVTADDVVTIFFVHKVV